MTRFGGRRNKRLILDGEFERGFVENSVFKWEFYLIFFIKLILLNIFICLLILLNVNVYIKKWK